MSEHPAAAERILAESGEPLSAEAIAARILGDEDRPIVPYSMNSSFKVGDRISYETRHGRLVGTVETSEFAAGRWRITVDWNPTLSPGLRAYLKTRLKANARLFYVFDPAGDTPMTRIDTTAEGSDAPSLVQLLALDLADHLRGNSRFAEWSGTWSPRMRLPVLDLAELERALLRATMDDGIAQTDQVLDLMQLPGPAEGGHGFAAVAVNRAVAQRGGWIWGGPRDGGEWLPDNALAKVFALIGAPPLIEDVLSDSSLVVIAESDLPEGLETFLMDETIRELSLRTGQARLAHIVSTWERDNRVLRFDAGERRFFPAQARVFLTHGTITSSALLDHESGMMTVEDPDLHARLAHAVQILLERLGDTDTFRIEIVEATLEETPIDEGSLLEIIIFAFAGDEPKTALEVLESVLTRHPGDRAVIARIVAMCLATYECFESPDDIAYTYRADRGHTMRRVATRTVSVADLVRRSREDRRRAEMVDREAGRFRLAERSPHWVRGHRRTLSRGQRASTLQIAVARRHGMLLGRDQTFVRPHRRAAHGDADSPEL